ADSYSGGIGRSNARYTQRHHRERWDEARDFVHECFHISDETGHWLQKEAGWAITDSFVFLSARSRKRIIWSGSCRSGPTLPGILCYLAALCPRGPLISGREGDLQRCYAERRRDTPC